MQLSPQEVVHLYEMLEMVPNPDEWSEREWLLYNDVRTAAIGYLSSGIAKRPEGR